MTTERDTAGDTEHGASQTDHVLAELQLYGFRAFADEPDPRPLPDGAAVAGAIADIFDALVASLTDTRLEPDLDDLLWSSVNLFHRAGERIERELDSNERAQRRGQREQDGGEIKSVELERLVAEGLSLIERRNAFELMRDQAAELFERHTGSSWRPRSGSMVNHRNLTAAVIDSRDFLAAKHRAETEVMLPQGPKIAFTGGLDCNDHKLIWETLDKVGLRLPRQGWRVNAAPNPCGDAGGYRAGVDADTISGVQLGRGEPASARGRSRFSSAWRLRRQTVPQLSRSAFIARDGVQVTAVAAGYCFHGSLGLPPAPPRELPPKLASSDVKPPFELGRAKPITIIAMAKIAASGLWIGT